MRDSLCCSGVEMQSAALREDADSFTVSAASLPGGGGSGVYWCGVLANGTVLVKLAESYFYSSMLVYVWSIARWVVLPSVLALTFLVSWYSTRDRKGFDSTRVLEEQSPPSGRTEAPPPPRKSSSSSTSVFLARDDLVFLFLSFSSPAPAPISSFSFFLCLCFFLLFSSS
ncbi:hypothetical protein N1851_017065 [Merluccius polli]|uniref:Uncharacterized protein n=1 Tax=Merluccius polli TaxID=89951 RepID=A0AA47P1L7_MERPO|nr:hypothetical protein N1851_017065 [Merluccius polli]